MVSRGHHQERLADQIRIEVDELIAGELEDPRIGSVTATRADLSPDLRHCRIWISVVGDEKAQQDSLEGLSSATGFVRRELAQRLQMKHAPEVIFVLDRGEANAERVDQILDDMKKG